MIRQCPAAGSGVESCAAIRNDQPRHTPSHAYGKRTQHRQRDSVPGSRCSHRTSARLAAHQSGRPTRALPSPLHPVHRTNAQSHKALTSRLRADRHTCARLVAQTRTCAKQGSPGMYRMHVTCAETQARGTSTRHQHESPARGTIRSSSNSSEHPCKTTLQRRRHPHNCSSLIPTKLRGRCAWYVCFAAAMSHTRTLVSRAPEHRVVLSASNTNARTHTHTHTHTHASAEAAAAGRQVSPWPLPSDDAV